MCTNYYSHPAIASRQLTNWGKCPCGKFLLNNSKIRMWYTNEKIYIDNDSMIIVFKDILAAQNYLNSL